MYMNMYIFIYTYIHIYTYIVYIRPGPPWRPPNSCANRFPSSTAFAESAAAASSSLFAASSACVSAAVRSPAACLGI